MKRIKKRIFSGTVCEQLVFNVSDRTRNIKAAKPRLRFKTQEERERHKMLISRRNHARLINENMDPSGHYSTLTFNNRYEVHTFDEARIVRDRFFRRLKYHHPEAVIFLYMGRGESTDRIHFHMISKGVSEETIRKHWFYGEVVRVDPLREHNYYEGKDHGQDYTGLANYCFDHWTPEVGGHRWKMTKNVRRPQEEDAQEAKRNYTVEKPPKAPKGYMLIEARANQYGYLYFRYVKIPPPHMRRKKKTGPPPVI